MALNALKRKRALVLMVSLWMISHSLWADPPAEVIDRSIQAKPRDQKTSGTPSANAAAVPTQAERKPNATPAVETQGIGEDKSNAVIEALDANAAKPMSQPTLRQSGVATSSSPQPLKAKPAVQNAKEHWVKGGDTLYSISFRYGLDVKSLAQWNGLSDAHKIKIGQRLRLSPPGFSFKATPATNQLPNSDLGVAPADNRGVANAISTNTNPISTNSANSIPVRSNASVPSVSGPIPEPIRTHVPLDAEARAQADARVRARENGAVATTGIDASRAAMPSPAASNTTPRTQTTTPPVLDKPSTRPITATGNSNSTPAATPLITVQAGNPNASNGAVSTNRVDSNAIKPLAIKPGPAASSAIQSSPNRPASNQSAPIQPGSIQPGSIQPGTIQTMPPRSAATVLDPKRPDLTKPDSVKPESIKAIASVTPTVIRFREVGGVQWRWPVDGRVVQTFLAGNPTRQGLDIQGKDGQTVRSAADGEVVYSGNGLVGYGELIIIKHSAEFLSAYGHNRKRLVTEGQKIKAGDAIAELGGRDGVLHFEIRRHGKPVDPRPMLPE